jgi:hypothetical protein
MTREEFANAIYPILTEKGYKDVKIANGKPYNSKDMYFCPQAPSLFMLTILPGRTELTKMGNSRFRANLSTKVNGPQDIDRMHEEINNIIYNSDESTLVNKNTGCLTTFFLLTIPFITLISYLIFY